MLDPPQNILSRPRIMSSRMPMVKGEEDEGELIRVRSVQVWCLSPNRTVYDVLLY